MPIYDRRENAVSAYAKSDVVSPGTGEHKPTYIYWIELYQAS